MIHIFVGLILTPAMQCITRATCLAIWGQNQGHVCSHVSCFKFFRPHAPRNERGRAAHLSHGGVIIVIVIIDAEEEYPPPLDTNAKFTDPVRRQLANMAAPIHCPTWQPPLCSCKCLNCGFLLRRAALTLISALVSKGSRRIKLSRRNNVELFVIVGSEMPEFRRSCVMNI